jgi:hypothetical protein
MDNCIVTNLHARTIRHIQHLFSSRRPSHAAKLVVSVPTNKRDSSASAQLLHV